MAAVDNTDPNPWGEHIEARNVFGDYWFIRGLFPKAYWYAGYIMCLVFPPSGVFILVFLYSMSIQHADDPVNLDLDAGT